MRHGLTAQDSEIWIVFSGQSDINWLKWLKSGFKHCFALVREEDRWVTLDPLSHCMELRVHNTDVDFDLPQWLRERGHKVIPVRRKEAPHKIAPLLPFTCVEAVKRLIGVHSWTILTPWQLYKHLTSPVS